jgi:hypothetical protein
MSEKCLCKWINGYQLTLWKEEEPRKVDWEKWKKKNPLDAEFVDLLPQKVTTIICPLHYLGNRYYDRIAKRKVKS